MKELLQIGAERGIWRQSYLDSYAKKLLVVIQEDLLLIEGV